MRPMLSWPSLPSEEGVDGPVGLVRVHTEEEERDGEKEEPTENSGRAAQDLCRHVSSSVKDLADRVLGNFGLGLHRTS